MVNLVILFILGIIDIRQREVPIKFMIAAILIWIIPVILHKDLKYSALVVSALIILFSLVTRQAFGLADSAVLSLISLKSGVFSMFLIFLISDVLLLGYSGIRFCLNKKDRSLPFIPFIAVTYLFIMIFYKGML